MVEEPKNVRVPRLKSHIKCPIEVGIVGPRKRLVQSMLVVVSIENIHLDWVITCIHAFWAFESHLSQVAPKMNKEHWCNEFMNPHEGFENNWSRSSNFEVI
jgi:hypothetical protein